MGKDNAVFQLLKGDDGGRLGFGSPRTEGRAQNILMNEQIIKLSS